MGLFDKLTGTKEVAPSVDHNGRTCPLLLVGLAVILTFRFAGSMGVPMMGGPEFLASLMVILIIAVGDPLIWIARKYYPAIVPVKTWNIINLRAILLVK